MNLKTKIIITIFLLFTIIYLLDKFFDNYTFVSPVKKLEFQWIIQKRTKTASKTFKNPARMLLKQGEKDEIISTDISKKSRKIKALEPQSLIYQNISDDRESKIEWAKKAIYVYFGRDEMAYRIAQLESNFRCDVISKTKDYGLFQINEIHMWRFKKFNGNPLDCWDNAKVAYEIWKEQGWNAWTSYKLLNK